MVENSFLNYLNEQGNIRLVIGNGFDLYCGIHTTYNDYYCKNWEKYYILQRAIHNYLNRDIEIDFSNETIRNSNIWDVFFALHSDRDPKKCRKNWCEIEKLILASLLSKKAMNEKREPLRKGLLSKIHWPEIKEYITGKMVSSDPYERLITKFIQQKMNKTSVTAAGYYEFLLDQLNEFEKSFGEFINGQIHNTYLERINHGRIQAVNSIYLKKVDDLLRELCPFNEKVFIDSFNYSSFDDIFGNRKIVLNHVNGSHKNPIFGVDSQFGPDDPRFIFTKTSRRIESKMVYKNYMYEEPFANIVVFGHSLDEADYSYYFPIFDKLNMLDSNASGTIVFAFNIYDNKKARRIKSDLREGVSKMLYNYAKDHQIPNPNRFLDSISTQRRVLFYEVKDIDKEKYKYMNDSFENEWQSMMDRMNDRLIDFPSDEETF